MVRRAYLDGLTHHPGILYGRTLADKALLSFLGYPTTPMAQSFLCGTRSRRGPMFGAVDTPRPARGHEAGYSEEELERSGVAVIAGSAASILAGLGIGVLGMTVPDTSNVTRQTSPGPRLGCRADV